MGFVEWFDKNIYANVFTLVTVILSGLISWVISACYYHMGNRVNLKVSVILPVLGVIKETYSEHNYKKLCKFWDEYSAKFMQKKERVALSRLKDAYKNVCRYKDNAVNATILFNYFKKKLKDNNIELNPIPVVINDEIVDYEPPQGMFELEDDLERILNKFDPDYQPDECQEAVNKLFCGYCKTYYSTTKVMFFNELSLNKVIKQSDITEEWNRKFREMNEAKEAFCRLPIVAGVIGGK